MGYIADNKGGSRKDMHPRFIIYFLLGLVVFLIPILFQSNYWIYMLTMVGFFMILVSSLDLAYGYTDLVSLAHAAFFGIGAYSSAILQVKLGIPITIILVERWKRVMSRDSAGFNLRAYRILRYQGR